MLPKNPVMLLSVINMHLRDNYQNLDSLCDDLDIRRSDIEEALLLIGYAYDKKQNRFL